VTMQEPALSLRGIVKSFPGVRAVRGVDLDLFPGEIHALVGENGAGKSTLSAIAYGELAADEGTVHARGNVGLVHQHFELIGRLRVWQNVLLGREPHRGWQIDEAAARERVAQIAQRNGLGIDPDAFVETLPIGVQQRVELLRELDREPAVLLLDEPTAALAPAEIDGFFATVVALAQRGAAVMIVTHKLQEVARYAQRVTVMRHGEIVDRMLMSETTTDAIARAMVGGDVPALVQREATVQRPALEVRDLRAGANATRVEGLSFEVRTGEIVGIAGVEGNGQTTIADAISNVIPYEGTIVRGGDLGIVPQDRQREALAMNWPVVDNVLLGRQHRPQARRGLAIDRTRLRAQTLAIVERFDIRAANVDVPVRTLSGGNQQKLVVGRALIDEPPIVLAYNPTRGIDVGAAALVQSQLIRARNRGAAVVLISFELDEILALADRVLVMYRGAIVGRFDRASIDRAEIGRLMAGSA
jgi:general nucleoside transport system ATP-binding protein